MIKAWLFWLPFHQLHLKDLLSLPLACCLHHGGYFGAFSLHASILISYFLD